MTKLNKFLLAAAIIAIVAAFLKFSLIYSNRHQQVYSLRVIELSNGWGYDILKNNKLYIHQTSIPVIQGNVLFADKVSAERTGQLVLKKLQNNKLPTITKKELDSLKIKL